MSISDPIADMLTRIRNANTAKHDTVDIPASKMKQAIANILLEEGYLQLKPSSLMREHQLYHALQYLHYGFL